MELPGREARSACLARAQAWTDAATDAVHHAFMVGENVGRARLLTAPLDFVPPVAEVCRTARQRRHLFSTGATFVWCTLTALAGAPVGDIAARAVVATEAFVKPVRLLADFAGAGSAPAVAFRYGASPATSVLRRPILDGPGSAPPWRAVAADRAWAQGLRASLLDQASDPLLSGWLDIIRPLDPAAVPPELLAAPPDFKDERLDSVPLTRVYRPLHTPWLALQPPQPPPPPGAPGCVASPYGMQTASRARELAWCYSC